MRILLIGSGGQVGSALSGRLPAAGFEVRAPGRDELDLTDAPGVTRAIADWRPRVVVNAAAYTAVDRAEQERDVAFALNRDGPGTLAAACAANAAALIHISTDYVFDGLKNGAYGENDSVNPVSAYGHSKLDGETAIRHAVEQHVILRTSWVFSAVRTNFVRTILRLAKERDTLRIVADQWGGPTYAGHIADAIVSIVRRITSGATPAWGTYHYSGAPDVNWHAFAAAIVEDGLRHGLLSRAPAIHPIPTSEYPTPAKRPPNSRFNCARIREVFGVERPDWRTGLDEVLRVLKKAQLAVV